ncbi:hypothetical protein EC988_009715, partial [Linderina pennispora]
EEAKRKLAAQQARNAAARKPRAEATGQRTLAAPRPVAPKSVASKPVAKPLSYDQLMQIASGKPVSAVSREQAKPMRSADVRAAPRDRQRTMSPVAERKRATEPSRKEPMTRPSARESKTTAGGRQRASPVPRSRPAAGDRCLPAETARAKAGKRKASPPPERVRRPPEREIDRFGVRSKSLRDAPSARPGVRDSARDRGTAGRPASRPASASGIRHNDPPRSASAAREHARHAEARRPVSGGVRRP